MALLPGLPSLLPCLLHLGRALAVQEGTDPCTHHSFLDNRQRNEATKVAAGWSLTSGQK